MVAHARETHARAVFRGRLRAPYILLFYMSNNESYRNLCAYARAMRLAG